MMGGISFAIHEARIAEKDAEIERLRRQVEQLRAALEPFARHADALSLFKALGNIEREHLLAARDAVAMSRTKDF